MSPAILVSMNTAVTDIFVARYAEDKMKMLVCVMIKGLPIPLVSEQNFDATVIEFIISHTQHGSRRKALVWKPEELQVAVSTRVWDI